ncbi:MAG: hypothetical protein V7638_1031 [Acidobacteriota bacterium]|jgi:hypothetical protein
MKDNLPLKLVVSTIGLLAAIVHVSRPDLRIDSVTIVLLVIAVIPWTQPPHIPSRKVFTTVHRVYFCEHSSSMHLFLSTDSPASTDSLCIRYRYC